MVIWVSAITIKHNKILTWIHRSAFVFVDAHAGHGIPIITAGENVSGTQHQ